MKPLYKYFPLFVAILVLAIVSIGIYGGTVVRSIFFERITADLENGAELLKNIVQQQSYSDIDSFCNNAGTEHVRITVVDANGIVLGDSQANPEQLDNHGNRPEIVEAYRGRTGISIRYSSTLNRNLVYLALPPFRLGGEQIVLRTATPFRSLRLDLEGAYTRIGLAGAVILILLTMLGFLSIRRVNDSLHIIHNAVQEYAKGNLTFRPMVRRPPALKEVANTISNLADDLHTRINEVSRQRDELEAVFGGMEEAVIVLDTKLVIREMNESARRLTEFDDAIGKDLLLVFRNSVLHDIAQKVRAGDGRIESEIEHFRGNERYLQVHGSVIRGAGEDELRIVLVLNDVSRLKELERVRRDFVANVSHELKTPITAVKGYVETLLEGDYEAATSKSFLNIVLHHVDRLSAIVEDLLTISRLEKGSAPSPELVLSDVGELVRGVATIFEQRAKENGIELAVESPQDETIEANRVLLEQAVANLVDNALKYSDEDGVVTISVESEDDAVTISVRDQGVGIPQEHLERIFERFYRVDKGRSRELGGTGLGLSIVKHIATSHGGHVSVKSEEGEGSIFSIVLPKRHR